MSDGEFACGETVFLTETADLLFSVRGGGRNVLTNRCYGAGSAFTVTGMRENLWFLKDEQETVVRTPLNTAPRLFSRQRPTPSTECDRASAAVRGRVTDVL